MIQSKVIRVKHAFERCRKGSSRRVTCIFAKLCFHVDLININMFVYQQHLVWRSDMRSDISDTKIRPRHEKTYLRVLDQVRLEPACSATETSWSVEISYISTTTIVLSKQRTKMVLIRRMRRLIYIFVVRIWHKTGFCHDESQMILN